MTDNDLPDTPQPATPDDQPTDNQPTDDEPTDDEPTGFDSSDDEWATGAAANDDPGETGSDAPPFDAPPPPVPPVRRLRRTEASSGPGVAGGIARYLGVETGLVKAAFVVASFFGGLGIFAYVAGWALIPRERHPDPRPVVLNGSMAGLVIGTLALIGAVSVAFGAGGAAGNLLAPALLIGIGFYLLDQRSHPQVVTQPTAQRAERPSWIPPLTTTPVPPEAYQTGTSAYANPPAQGAPYSSEPASAPWGAVHTDPVVEAKPRPPVTAVTMAITAGVVALMIGLDQFAGLDISVAQMFGAALAIIVTGIIVSLFIGRALGLWFAGFIALIGLAVSPIAVSISANGVGSKEYTIIDGSDLADEYLLGTGELIVDLGSTTFSTDAATNIELSAGSIVLYLPQDVSIDLRANARFGQVIAPLVSATGSPSGLTDEVSGPDSEIDRRYEGREGSPTVSIDADVRFGSIEVRRG